MRSLINAIDLYREEADKEDNNKCFMIVKKINNTNIPLKNKNGQIEYYDNIEKAHIERIYYQPDYKGLLKVIEV